MLYAHTDGDLAQAGSAVMTGRLRGPMLFVQVIRLVGGDAVMIPSILVMGEFFP